MSDLLFTTLTLAILYYFFYYLPQQEKANQPIRISQAVQTDPFTTQDEKLLENTIDELIKQIKQLNQILK